MKRLISKAIECFAVGRYFKYEALTIFNNKYAQLQKLCYQVALLACLNPSPHILVRPCLIMKDQPPPMRTGTVLFTVMVFLLLSQIRTVFDHIYFAGRL